MLQKKPEFDLSSQEGELTFDDIWRDDKLDRRKVAEYLTPVVASINQPFVLSLEAPYGTGKTFFVRHWCKHIELECKAQGHKTAYFNAWETDFSNDVISAFINSLQKQFGKDERIREKIGELAKKTAGFLRSKALPLILRGVANKLVGQDVVQEAIGHIGLETSDVASFLSEAATEALQAQQDAEEAMEKFKNFLSDLAGELVGGGRGDNAPHGNLYVFVDDLDRCRPTYALEVLEAIKHLFAVQGVVFVLALDQEQLKSVIKSVYGQDLDTDGYLRRFIDWGFKLPKPSANKFVAALVEAFDWKSMPEVEKLEGVTDFFSYAAEAYRLSLRQQSQIFTHINLAYRHIGSQHPAFNPWLTLFAILREQNSALYEKACLSNDNSKELSREMILTFSEKKLPPLLPGHWNRTQEILTGVIMTDKEHSKIVNQGTPKRTQLSKEDSQFHAYKALESYSIFARNGAKKSLANEIYSALEGAEVYRT